MAPTPASIRLPPPLREQIRERASAERRSFSSQCVVLLESALAGSDGAAQHGDAGSAPTVSERR